MLVASANPEDYTNRGRIITPLKDRFGAQIRTHYPLEVATEIAVIRQEANPLSDLGVSIEVPSYMMEIIATISHMARLSSDINQRSGVSVRLSVANFETLSASAARRALRLGEAEAVPRISDLDALVASTSGKVEIESIDEGREGQVVDDLIKRAVLTVFRARVPMDSLREAVVAFDEGGVVHAGDDVASVALTEVLTRIPTLRPAVASLAGSESPAALASATEFILEGLHLSKRLNKDASGARATYRAR
jgi:magnesium chelatase subunit I